MTKRALVTGIGGLRGAYSAGVIATLGKNLEEGYFDAVYASSVGVFASTFFVSNQPNTIESTWRNLVDGKKLVSFLKPLMGRRIMDLDYLVKIFNNEKSFLNVEAVINSGINVTYAVTNLRTGKVEYKQPSKENIFDLMKASCALPFFHGPVQIDGINYVDGSLTDPLPIEKAKEDGYDEIVVVWNKPKGFYVDSKYKKYAGMLSSIAPKKISQLIKGLEEKMKDVDFQLENDKTLRIIRPSSQIPLKSILDTDKKRLNDTIDMGVEDAKRFLETISRS